jgi:hypothetical protein
MPIPPPLSSGWAARLRVLKTRTSLPYFFMVRCLFACVIVHVVAGVENGGEGAEGGVGDLGPDGGLAVFVVPQDVQVEHLEQAGLEVAGQAGQDVPGQGELVEQGGVGGLGGTGGGEGAELGLELVAVGVQLAEPGPDPGRIAAAAVSGR